MNGPIGGMDVQNWNRDHASRSRRAARALTATRVWLDMRPGPLAPASPGYCVSIVAIRRGAGTAMGVRATDVGVDADPLCASRTSQLGDAGIRR
ncbi:hypothetical protein ACF3M1_00470 [Luteimonas sp. WGS1318]|uniref:hypothetical protein n=1 Tax=Luteimonas sp. WGS1318 TaxID=3366815 RepID=UPI00372D32B7